MVRVRTPRAAIAHIIARALLHAAVITASILAGTKAMASTRLSLSLCQLTSVRHACACSHLAMQTHASACTILLKIFNDPPTG